MINNISNQNAHELGKCLICWENIGTQKWSKCVRCNIILHNLCEEIYRGDKKICQCPHCRRIGSIGSYK